MVRRFWIENYGCQMNLAEANALESVLQESGWVSSVTEELADAVILNSCSVRLSAENRLWGRLAHFEVIKQKRDFKLIVMGCMAERLQEGIKERCPAVDYVVGAMAKDEIPKLLNELFNDMPVPSFLQKEEYTFFSNHNVKGSIQGLVPIMHGCDNYCTYCIIPFVRGREVSRPAQEIITEIQRLEERNIHEVVLIGQNVNSYHFEEVDFNELLRMIIKETSIPRIRFITPHPTDFNDEFIEVLASHDRICNHVHLPLQHASDRILEEMNRGYTLEWYRSMVFRLRRAIPDVNITTDLMVGFPSETEEDFMVLYDYLDEVLYNEAFMYYYNPIPGTPAAERDDQIPEEIQKERLARLIEKQLKISANLLKKEIGRVNDLLVEGVSRNNAEELMGRNQYNQSVIFPGELSMIGDFVTVENKKINGKTLWGEII